MSENKPIQLYYVTDPICSHCWAVEPQLKRFMEQYKAYFNVTTIMGGLLEKWGEGPIDPANGIYKPADVAGHWREAGDQSRMPIDGSLMEDDHVESSYPASRVYKVIQKHHGDEAAFTYLRRAREELFAFNKNIGKEAVLIDIVNQLGYDGEAIVSEAETEAGQALLNEDFQFARSLGARGFPTIILANQERKGVKIGGGRPLEYYEAGLKQILGEEEITASDLPSLSEFLQEEELLFSKEIEVLYDVEQQNIPTFLEQELTADEYESKEILGELYIVKK